MPITEHTIKTERHTTFYLAEGPENGPLVIFVHGWPELSISWQRQMHALAALGFRTIAPDMRGYGRSSVYSQQAAYAQKHIVRDMLELLDAVGREKAVWVGHDWGSAVVWNLASHHPDRCYAVANLCIPYYTLERGLDQLVALVDRELYPENEFPAGQWDYMLHYQENMAEAIAPMDANVSQYVRLLFRKGDPAGEGKRAFTAMARRSHSFFATLYLQNVLGYSPFQAGLGFVPMGLLAVITANLTPQLINRLGVKWTLVLAMLLMAAGVALTALILTEGTFWNLVLLSLPIGVGISVAFPSMTLAAVAGVQDFDQGLASGLVVTSQQLGGALGLALVTLLAAVSTPVITGLHPQAGAINQALISGFRPALLFAAAFALLGMLLALGGLKGSTLRKRE